MVAYKYAKQFADLSVVSLELKGCYIAWEWG